MGEAAALVYNNHNLIETAIMSYYYFGHYAYLF